MYPSLSFRSSGAPPILELLFNGSNGSTTFLDTSPNAFTVSRNGTNAQISTSRFYNGGSSLLNTSAIDSYLTVPHDAVFDFAKSDFTIEFYVYFNLGAATTNIIRKGYKSTYSPWLLAFDGSQIVFYSSGTPGAFSLASNIIASSSHVNLNQWNKIAVQRKSLQFYGYRNDSLIFTTSLQDQAVLDNNQNIYISGNGTIAGLDGYLDSVRIYNYARY